MSHVETEVLLVAGILAFYLLDSSKLLHFDELQVAATRRGWRVSTGSDLEMRGRFVLVPNPLLPARTRFHASWLPPGGEAVEGADALRGFARSLWPVRAGCVLVGALVLVALPVLLLAHRDPAWLLAVLAASTAVTSAMLLAAFARRGALRLDGRSWLALAVESLLCPPCAPNLYRKLCDRRGFRDDPVAFAARHLPLEAQQRLHAAIDARIALLAQADEDDHRARDVRAARERIRALLP
ncbi:MAG: hypothetical protein KA124_15275 [Luteimonas sp.]|nr:hypothetical protein [Luteimonas sp.]